jgi:hypothetical protein
MKKGKCKQCGSWESLDKSGVCLNSSKCLWGTLGEKIGHKIASLVIDSFEALATRYMSKKAFDMIMISILVLTGVVIFIYFKYLS